jgi:hypothetical protein
MKDFPDISRRGVVVAYVHGLCTVEPPRLSVLPIRHINHSTGFRRCGTASYSFGFSLPMKYKPGGLSYVLSRLDRSIYWRLTGLLS